MSIRINKKGKYRMQMKKQINLQVLLTDIREVHRG